MVGDKAELPLEGLQACVKVDGVRARVLLDCQFYNDQPRQFEGTFQLRLPDEAAPFFLAFGETAYKSPEPPARLEFLAMTGSLDREHILASRSESWRQVKEARMVPRDTAANAYRETVNRRVDPALMEWAGAGIFNARVFPLAGHTLHRIVIGYDLDCAAKERSSTVWSAPSAVEKKPTAALSNSTLPKWNRRQREMSPKPNLAHTDGRLRLRLDHPAELPTVRISRPVGAAGRSR